MIGRFVFYAGTLCAFTLWSNEIASTPMQGSLGENPIEFSTEELVSPLAAADSLLDQKQRPAEEKGAPPMRVGFRYTTPEGIGYKHGYTTLEAFFSSLHWNKWLGFLDLRGHVFDDGKLAANAGVGARRLSSSRIWGVNVYYDYRNTQHQHYNQVAAGIEALGRVWDFRLNGYLPVGDKLSRPRHTEFDHFKGHHIFLNSKRDFALKGGEFEVGLHAGTFKGGTLYFAGGPYYLNGKGATAWGGEFRGVLDFFDGYLRIEGNTSYDSFFHWIGQGQISVNIPFGKNRKIACPKQGSCEQKKTMYARGIQRIDRHEIIPVGTFHDKTVAIDPATKKPYYVVFVDNTSSSLGTFESPYSSLATAQANSSVDNIIYLFPGDGTSTNMDMGITLQDRQMLLGASTAHPISTTLGNVVIPPYASLLPVVTNTAVAPVVTLANNNTVSGLYIENFTSSGIQGTNINNFAATQNSLVGGDGTPGDAILLTDVTGSMNINSNLFTQVGGNATVHIVETGSSQCSVDLSNNSIYVYGSNLSGFLAELSDTAMITTLNISNTRFEDVTTSRTAPGIKTLLADDSSISDLSISNCLVTNFSNGLEFNFTQNGFIENALLSASTFSANNNGFQALMASTGSITNLAVSHCAIAANNLWGINPILSSSGSIQNFLIDNSILDFDVMGLRVDLPSTGSITNLEISNSSLSNNSAFAILSQYGASTGSIHNILLDHNTFHNNGAIGVQLFLQTLNKLDNVIVSNCTFEKNGAQGLLISGSTQPIESITVKNSHFSSGSQAIQINLNAGSLDNLEISQCDIKNCSSNAVIVVLNGAGNLHNSSIIGASVFNSSQGLQFIGAGPGMIQNLLIQDVNMDKSTYGINATSPISSCTVANCTIKGSLASGILINNAANLSLLNNFLSGNSIGYNVTAPSAFSGVIANNTFEASGNKAIQFSTSSGTSALSVSDNFMSSSASTGVGYGAAFTTNGGTLCLDFVHNTAIPTTLGGGNDPYYFHNAAGTFNVTSETTQANNTGLIFEQGAIGSCP